MGTQSRPETAELGANGMLRQKKRRLLMVMNREEMRRLRAILRPLEATIDWAVDVDSAHVAMDAPGVYDAVIVDDKLPEEGWRKVMESAGELGVRAPFLVCTNLEGSDEFLTQSRKTFISDLLLRPYVEEIVRARVRNALETDEVEPYKGATVSSHQ